MSLHVVDHPLVRHKLAILRDAGASPKKFRELVSELTLLLTYEATRSLPTREIEIATPLASCKAATLEGLRIVIAPILRAGLGMVQGMLDLIPTASVAHIGMYRDERTLEPRVYYQSMPREMEGAMIFIVDPMLATAGSMTAAVALIKKANPARITVLSLIAAPEGVARMTTAHPDVDIYAASLDSHLNERAYIVPGLGDAGDRLFASFKVDLERG